MTVRNRVWDTVQGGLVVWETEFPDSLGVAYPGPDAFANVTDYCVSGGAAVVEGPESLPDTTFDPVSRWQFNGTLDDNDGVDDLIVQNGTIQYIDGPIAGVQSGEFPDRTDRMAGTTDPAVADHRILGALTVAAWVWPGTTLGPGSLSRIFDVGLTGAGTANNFLCVLNFHTDPGRPRLRWQDSTQTFQDISAPSALSLQEWHHVVAVRYDGGASSVVARLYGDGVLLAEVTGLEPAFDGANGRVHVGQADNSSNGLDGRLSGLTLYDRALTQAEVIALYKKGIPPEAR